ncbi:MAG: ATP synthase F1 subunit delta [Planctomycetota bacterium]
MTEAVKHETVLDTGAEKLGKTYAAALISAAQSAGVADEVVAQLGTLVDTYLAGSDALQAAFASPRISGDEKVRVIDKLFASEFHPVLVKFLKVMAGRDRLAYVASVRSAADELHDDMMGRVVASIRTAVALDDGLRGQIQSKLSETLQRDVRLRETIDPDLIGGMVIRIGDRVYDSSIRNRLDQMSKRVQSGFAQKLLEKFETFTQN